MTYGFLDVVQKKPLADVLGAEAVSEEDNIYSAALCGFVECDDLVFGVLVVVLGDTAGCPVVFVLEFEDNLALTARTVRHLQELRFDHSLALAFILTQDHPIRLTLYNPFLISVQHKLPCDLRVQRSGHIRSYGQIAVRGDAFEVVPAWCRLVLNYCGFRDFYSEIVLGDSIERSGLNVWRNCTFADDLVDAEAVLEGSTTDMII